MKPGGILHITECSAAVPVLARMEFDPAGAAPRAGGAASRTAFRTSVEARSSVDTSEAAFRMYPRSNLISEEGFKLH